MGEMRNDYKILVENPKSRGHLQVICENGRIILKWILKIMSEVMDWIHLTQNGTG
jgi:hypothetical protein